MKRATKPRKPSTRNRAYRKQLAAVQTGRAKQLAQDAAYWARALSRTLESDDVDFDQAFKLTLEVVTTLVAARERCRVCGEVQP